jgi:hypothetical protein
VIDALVAAGWSTVSAYQGAFALLGVCCSLSYLWFLWRREPGLAVAGAVTAR